VDRAARVRASTTRSYSSAFAVERAVAYCAQKRMVVVLDAPVVLHDVDQQC